jgi:hypothetical protein
MFFVEARYHNSPKRAGSQVRYISHREEALADGRRRELYGIGERYRVLRGDEKAIRNALREDGQGLRNPAYFRFILTVDNAAAARFQRLDGHLSERVMCDAVEKTFRSTARGAQGVFAVHQHGGQDRLAHPHVHALLSPRFANRMPVYISPVRIQRIKEAWEREVLRGLERQERRLALARQALARTSPPSARDRDERPRGLHLLPSRGAARREGQLETLATARRSLQLARDNVWARQWLRFGRRGRRWEQNPERAARQALFRLASRAMPKPIREVLRLVRGLRDVDVRQR